MTTISVSTSRLLVLALVVSGAAGAQALVENTTSSEDGTERSRQRLVLAHAYRDLDQALEIDAATEYKVVDLLLDAEREQRDLIANDTRVGPDKYLEQLQARAAAETAFVDRVRAVLGPEKLERFLDFKLSQAERWYVTEMEQSLEPAHQLNVTQRERLIALFREHRAHDLDLWVHSARPAVPTPTPSQEELDRFALLEMIADKETVWRSLPQSTKRLRQEAAEFLSPPQLDAVERMCARATESFRQALEDDRARAGFSRPVPAQPDIKSRHAPLTGMVKMTTDIVVNSKPTRFTHIGRNATPVTFEVAEDLLIEAQPTLYSDAVFDVQLWWYELRPGSRRLIGTTSDHGMANEAQLLPNVPGQRGTYEMLAGRKGYAVSYNALVVPK